MIKNVGVIVLIISSIFLLNIFKFNSFLRADLFVDGSLFSKRVFSVNSSFEEIIKNTKHRVIKCDVTVVGAGVGGTFASIASSRAGAKTCLIAEDYWVGGMLTSAGVSAVDGSFRTSSGIYMEFLRNLKNYYEKRGQLHETQKCSASPFCFEPKVGNSVLGNMLKHPNLTVFINSTVDRVYREGSKVVGIKIVQDPKDEFIIKSKITIDGTEFGDLMYMADVPFDLGPDEERSFFAYGEHCLQPITYVAIIENKGRKSLIPKPKNYNEDNYKCTVANKLCPNPNTKFDMERLLNYGLLPGGKLMLNIPSHSHGNDFHATANYLDSKTRDEIFEKAKDYTRGYVYFLQQNLGFENYGFADEFDTEDKFARMPYVRESRRLVGMERLGVGDVLSMNDNRPVLKDDAIAIGSYPMDLHFCAPGGSDIYHRVRPYQIPYGVTVPKNIDGFMVVEKNISVTHLVNGTTRLQPVVASVGQAVGEAAALAIENNVEPRYIDVQELQKRLLENGSQLFYWNDLPIDHFAYPYVAKSALLGVVFGYSDMSFRPSRPISTSEFKSLYNNLANSLGEYNFGRVKSFEDTLQNLEGYITRGHAVDLLVRNFLNSTGVQGDNFKFEDVSRNYRYYDSIKIASSEGIINADERYFRPNDVLTRGEAVVLFARLSDLFNTVL